MARRWQLSLWVLAGLTAAIAGLWDSATVTAVADRVSVRTEAMDRSDGPRSHDPAASGVTVADSNGSRPTDGGSNMLRPTTSTTTRPSTTTTRITAPPDEPVVDGAGDGEVNDGDEEPGSATTTRIDGEGESATTGDRNGSSTTTSARSSTMPAADPGMTTVYTEDFAGGALAGDRWVVADAVAGSLDGDALGLFRPSSVVVLPDPTAAGGHVLAITARMGSGAEAGQVVSGAVRLVGHELGGGRFTIRARVDPDPDGVTAGVVLLRSVAAAGGTETADGEIRIVETSRHRTTRTPVESTLTWTGPTGAASLAKAHRTAAGPVSAAVWRVYTLDWTADRVSVAVDGDPLDLTVDPVRVPSGPMELEFRLDPLAAPADPDGEPVLSGEVRLLIDWIRVERVTGGASS